MGVLLSSNISIIYKDYEKTKLVLFITLAFSWRDLIDVDIAWAESKRGAINTRAFIVIR